MTREEYILNSMNGVAKNYFNSRNLVKNINKLFKDEFVINACEFDKGGRYKICYVKDLEAPEKEENLKFKLLENENGVEFKSWNTKTNVLQIDIIKIMREKGELKPNGLDGLIISFDDLTFEENCAIREVISK